MRQTFVALRSIFYASVFLWFWTWVAEPLRRFDSLLGGALPVWSRSLGFGVLALGGTLAAWCIGAFIVQGHGAPALFDSPRRLVAVGPYRYMRNPMYVGGALLLLGFGFFQRSPSIVLFVPVWWLLFHLVVVLYEEVALRARFGPDYEEYCRRTPRWAPRFRHPASEVSVLLLAATVALSGAEQRPNFTGEWRLNPDKSDFGLLQGPDRRTDQIQHSEPVLRLTSRQARGNRESVGEWECRTDGSPCAVSIRGSELRLATQVTWDGAALVFDSRGEYDGSQVRMSDRWTVSPDGKILTIARRLSSERGETHQTVVLEKQ